MPGAKLYAFAVAAAIAGLGGILLAFRTTSINFSEFSSFNSITMVAYAMIGGIGYLFGPVIGATLAPGRLLRTAAELDRQRHRQIHPADRRRLADRPASSSTRTAIVKEQIAQIAFLRSKLGEADPVPRRRRSREPRVLPQPSGERRRQGREHGARGQGPDRQIRRHGRRRQRLADRQAGPGARPDRPQRRRQDLADRRRHRLHQNVPGRRS